MKFTSSKENKWQVKTSYNFDQCAKKNCTVQ
jgi:beta-glucanase (GH16 family)